MGKMLQRLYSLLFEIKEFPKSSTRQYYKELDHVLQKGKDRKEISQHDKRNKCFSKETQIMYCSYTRVLFLTFLI